MSTQIQESPTTSEDERVRVRVWFGKHTIADYTATPNIAASYADAMGRRFAGLRVTTDPLGPAEASPAPGDPHQLPLPESPNRWDLTAI